MNLGHLIENETEEIQQKVEECLIELKEIRENQRLLEERNTLLRGQLANTLELIGIGVGDHINAWRLGLSVYVRRNTYRKLNVEKLISLGVSRQLIDDAREESESKTMVYVRSHKENGVTNGVTNPTSGAQELDWQGSAMRQEPLCYGE